MEHFEKWLVCHETQNDQKDQKIDRLAQEQMPINAELRKKLGHKG